MHSNSTGRCCQRARTPRGEDTHDAEDNIEQSQRIRHQTPHATHARDSTEHPRGAICAPTNSSRGQEIPKHGVHGEENANETGQHQRQEAVPQDASRAWECKGGGEVTGGRGARHGGLVVRVVVGRVSGVWCGSGIECRRHEAEDEMQRNGAEHSDAIDVAIEDLAGEEEEGAVQDDIEYCSVEVAVVHEVIVDRCKGIENGQSLRSVLALFHRFPMFSLRSQPSHIVRLKNTETPRKVATSSSPSESPTLVRMCSKLTPSSSNNGGSPS